MSAVTCQKVTNGSQVMLCETSLPRVPVSQSGWERIRFGDHQTIGSDAFCR